MDFAEKFRDLICRKVYLWEPDIVENFLGTLLIYFFLKFLQQLNDSLDVLEV